MAIQLAITSRNARLDAIETEAGTAPKLQIRTGAPPADCAAGDTGSLLAEMTLPSDWMAAASGGAKAKLGTWQVAATGAGTAGHFRVKNSAGSATKIQGTCGQGSGDMSLDNTSIAVDQVVTVTTFTLTDGNA
jgi:hypothetical protein